MERYFVYVRKQGKWKHYSDHHLYEYAEINAQVQYQSGLESKVEFKDKVVLHLKKKEV